MPKIRAEITFETDQSKTTANYLIEKAAKELTVEGCTRVGEPRIVNVAGTRAKPTED